MIWFWFCVFSVLSLMLSMWLSGVVNSVKLVVVVLKLLSGCVVRLSVLCVFVVNDVFLVDGGCFCVCSVICVLRLCEKFCLFLMMWVLIWICCDGWLIVLIRLVICMICGVRLVMNSRLVCGLVVVVLCFDSRCWLVVLVSSCCMFCVCG